MIKRCALFLRRCFIGHYSPLYVIFGLGFVLVEMDCALLGLKTAFGEKKCFSLFLTLICIGH